MQRRLLLGSDALRTGYVEGVAVRADVRRRGLGDALMAPLEQVKPWLTGEAAHGDQAELAAACGMTPSALKMAVQRLKKRFRDCVKDEVAGTLEDSAMVAEEMLSLQAALAA